jgi:hypothetical protein
MPAITANTPVQFRLAQTDYDKLVDMARSHNYASPGLYVRALVGQLLDRDMVPRSRSVERSTGALSDAQRDGLIAISRVAGNLNQIARAMNSGDPLSEDLRKRLLTSLDLLDAASRSIR